MIETVIISDLHLHPHDADIQARFYSFLDWAKKNSVKKIYILGDFFHAWAGDDAIDDWSGAIASELNKLAQQGTQLYYMHGNRDFLLGQEFAKRAGWTILSEPTIIDLGNEKVLLVHGDRYCIKDNAHQWFRRLTRNRLFPWLFLKLPLSYRKGLVDKVRQISKESNKKSMEQMDVVAEAVISHMQYFNVHTLIHGHTHKPGLTSYPLNEVELKRYVLSDWDDMPLLLCYDYSKGIYFIHYC
jgi:UDP-2,3-diacylglucosamine hydrolase